MLRSVRYNWLWGFSLLVVLTACYSTAVTAVLPTDSPTSTINTENLTPAATVGENSLPSNTPVESVTPVATGAEFLTPPITNTEYMTLTHVVSDVPTAVASSIPTSGLPTPTYDVIETPTPIVTYEFAGALVVTPLGGMPLAICGTIRVLDIGYLNVRQGPGVEYTKIGTLSAGDVRDYYCDFVVTSVGGQDVWVCISAVYQVLRAEPFCTSWVAVKYAGRQLAVMTPKPVEK